MISTLIEVQTLRVLIQSVVRYDINTHLSVDSLGIDSLCSVL